MFRFLLVIIFSLSFFLRIYHLTSIPPGLHVDELSFGYNAYSLLHTGRDEFGVHLPFTLRALDDYRPAFMSYLMIPFIKIFGLSVMSIRLTSVALSLLTLFALYKIVSLITITKSKQLISLCTIFLFAISPWGIFMGRFAIETNAGVAFFLFGLWIFLEYVQRKKLWKILLSFAFFTLSFYSYHAVKLFLPFFLIMLFILNYKDLFAKKKESFIGLLFLLVIFIPFFLGLRNTASLSRLTYLNFFTQNQNTILAKSSQRLIRDTNPLEKIFDNRRVIVFPMLLTNYFSNLNPTWLYGDDFMHTQYKIPDFGLFYLFELPLLFIGMYAIIKKKLFSQKTLVLLLFWIVFSIIPASITIDTPSAVRIYTLLPACLLIEGCGLSLLIEKIYIIRNKFIQTFLFASIGIPIVISLLWFWHAYFTLFPFLLSQRYAYGVQEAITYATNHEKSYSQIFLYQIVEILALAIYIFSFLLILIQKNIYTLAEHNLEILQQITQLENIPLLIHILPQKIVEL